MLLSFLYWCMSWLSYTQNPTTVWLPGGDRMVGIRVEGVPGAGFLMQFLGIPYAEPPVGENRFRAPVPKGRRFAQLENKSPPACIQMIVPKFVVGLQDWWTPIITENDMQEDCLYLNVWVPDTSSRDTKLAVMVWIHGGSFYAGSSAPSGLYNGSVLASSEGVVVVSIQYRLGVFGFAYSDSDSDSFSGNVGLLDQVLALRWIKDNIGRFGGDPAKVTLFGQSAGAASVGHHLLSPLSQPLFAQMILQSGAPTAIWAVLPKEIAKNRTIETARRVGCYNNEIIDTPCMTRVDPIELSANSFFVSSGLIWGPIVDGTFLPGPVDKILASGNFKQGRILLGSNKDEFNSFFPTMLPNIYSIPLVYNTSHIIASDNQFHQIVYHLLPEPLKNDESFKKELTNLYPLSSTNREEILNEMFTDASFTCPALQVASAYARLGLNTYVYSFEYHSPSYSTPRWMGALHGDELPFIFGLPLRDQGGPFTAEEKYLSKTLMNYWANYAKYGDPTSIESETALDAKQWFDFGSSGAILVIEEKLAIGSNYTRKGSKCNFWQKYAPSQPQ